MRENKTMRTLRTIIRNRRPLKQSRAVIVLLIAVALVGINRGPLPVAAKSTTTQPTVVLQTTTVPMLAGVLQPINNGPGNQTDPHIDCDIVSYTDDDFQGTLQIRYFDFTTNTDNPVPGNGADSLSDVSGGRITFTEATLSGPQVVIFDTGTQTRTAAPRFGNSRPAIGGTLVAYEDRSFSTDPTSGNTASEMSVYDLSLQLRVRLTNDNLFDKNPAVSPDGNSWVWEKCQTNTSGCDIYTTIRFGSGTFFTRHLTGAGEDRGPDTNGQLVVYVSDKNGENDIYLQPVASGSEMHVPIPGDQRNVTMSGNLIAFESQVQLGNQMEYDIFVYDLSTANLYQVTNTLANETLNDITFCNGIGRIVFAAPDTDYDVYAFTFQIPSATENQIDDLVEMIESFNLPGGIENSLITKLHDALAAIDASDTATACDSLGAFINECRAQSGKKLTADQASQLINSATQIKTALGCQ
jgi:WD40 repeat protein